MQRPNSGQVESAILAYALTNPVFVDVDGNGRFDPLFPKKSGCFLPSLIPKRWSWKIIKVLKPSLQDAFGMNSPKALITGATGFIGSHLLERLAAEDGT